jgi:hypothetical protein
VRPTLRLLLPGAPTDALAPAVVVMSIAPAIAASRTVSSLWHQSWRPRLTGLLTIRCGRA